MNILLYLVLLGKILTVTHTTYVPFDIGKVLQWSEAESIALLAHDWLSGALFFDLELGDELELLYSDGSSSDYIVTDIVTIDAGFDNRDVYNRFYVNADLVLQTCTADDGRLFVMAEEEWKNTK